ncbi:MAG: hypothetical protein Q9192_005116 [Flavoplaca navasiana]
MLDVNRQSCLVTAATLLGFRGTPKPVRGLPCVALPLRILAVVWGLMREVHTASTLKTQVSCDAYTSAKICAVALNWGIYLAVNTLGAILRIERSGATTNDRGDVGEIFFGNDRDRHCPQILRWAESLDTQHWRLLFRRKPSRGCQRSVAFIRRTDKAVYAASYQAILKNPVSPTELAAFEHGTYEEVKKELIATARQMARQLRQKQTMQQLERLQLDDPEIIRLRHLPPTGIAELDLELPGPIELPGCDMTASSPDPDSCVYELNAVGNRHDLQEQHLKTLDTARLKGSETEPPYSDLEPLGNSDFGGNLAVPPLAVANCKASRRIQHLQPEAMGYLPNKDKAASKDHDGRLMRPDNLNDRGLNESRQDYSTRRTKYVLPTEANPGWKCQISSQAYSRHASGSSTLRNVDSEIEPQSLFTDLDTLVKALPARTSSRQR